MEIATFTVNVYFLNCVSWKIVCVFVIHFMAVWNRGVGWLWLQQKYIRKGNKFIIFFKRCEWERERSDSLICWPKKEKEERQGICDSCVTISLYECKCVASLSLLLCINILLPSYHFSVFASLTTLNMLVLLFFSIGIFLASLFL